MLATLLLARLSAAPLPPGRDPDRPTRRRSPVGLAVVALALVGVASTVATLAALG